jgi:hypothetical protein
MERKWVSDRAMWVVTESSLHDLSILSEMSGSYTASHPSGGGEGHRCVATSHCLHPAVEQGSAVAYRGTRDL